MKLSLFSAAPGLLLASSAAFAQQPPAPAPAPAAAAPAPAAVPAPEPAPVAPVPAPVDVAPAPPPPAPVAVAVLPPPPPPPPADAPALPAKLGISKDGFWQPGATLQFWALGNHQGSDYTTTFRIRRAELRVKGEIIPKTFGFNVMIDPSRVLDNSKATLPVTAATKGDPSPGSVSANNQGTVTILQDYFITFMSEYADVSLGQFKIPVSLEGYGSASKLLFPERSVVSRRYGDIRDLGIRVEKKLGKNFYYYAGLFNGEGQNKLDSNAQKDAALRLEVYPIDGITVGVVGYAGLHNRTTTATTKDRLEADVKVDLSNVVLQAEYIHGWDGPTAVARNESAGAYAAIGYTVMDQIQPLFRIGRYDPNVRGNAQYTVGERGLSTTPDDELTSYEFDVNYLLRGNDAKLQAAWSLFDFDQAKKIEQLIIAAQAAF